MKKRFEKRMAAMALPMILILMLVFGAGTAMAAAAPNWNNNACYGSGNPFTSGYKYQCSWYAWGRAKEVTGVSMSSRMSQFVNSSVTGGYTATPSTNAVAVYANSSGKILHVAFIESFDGKYVTYSEGNNGGLGTGPQKYYTTTMELSKFTSTTKKWVGSSCTSLKYVPLQNGAAPAATVTVQTKAATSVGLTNATVNGRVTKPAGVTVTQCGVYLGTTAANMTKRNTETVSSAANNKDGGTGFDIWYDLTKELKITLEQGNTYYYKIYAISGGKEYQGSVVSFTTGGHRHTPGAAATCTQPQKCTGCGTVLANALGHSAGAAATCTTDQTCTRCGEVLVNALGHSAGAAATCTTDQTCTRCGEVLAEALGHKAGSWRTVQDATFDAEGRRVIECTVCGKILSEESIPMPERPSAEPSENDSETEPQVPSIKYPVIPSFQDEPSDEDTYEDNPYEDEDWDEDREEDREAAPGKNVIPSVKQAVSAAAGASLWDQKSGALYRVTAAGTSGNAMVEYVTADGIFREHSGYRNDQRHHIQGNVDRRERFRGKQIPEKGEDRKEYRQDRGACLLRMQESEIDHHQDNEAQREEDRREGILEYA